MKKQVFLDITDSIKSLFIPSLDFSEESIYNCKTDGYDLPPIKWVGTIEQLRQCKNCFRRRQRITFNCKKCNKEETIALDRLILKKDLHCKRCQAQTSCEEKYGSGITNPSLAKAVIEKRKETFANKSPEIKAEERRKARETMIERYGDYYTRTEDYKIKSEKTNMERYGVRIGSMSDKIKAEVKQRNLEKYGIDNPAKVKSKIEKARRTFLNNYGVTNPSYIKEVKDKRVQTSLNHYGVPSPAMSETVREKMRNTLIERYGVISYAQTEASKEKMHNIYRPNFIKKINNISDKFTPLFNPESDYKGMKEEYEFQCKTCGKFFKDSLSGYYPITCPHCQKSGRSEKEKDLEGYIRSIYDKEIEIGNRTLISPYELDIYLPDLKLAFEFNGNYWHSEELLGDKKLASSIKYHQYKSLKCKELGIRLIHIFEYEWDNESNKNKIKNLIDFLIKGPDKRIYARNCIIKEVDSKEAEAFIEENHLQGNSNSKIKLGLYYNNELVSIMTFIKSRFNKNYEWELSRFCSKKTYQIIGGASKLFKYFEINYNPESIISYCDISKGAGRMYEKLGFIKKDVSSPNYKWVKNNVILSRYQTQKNKLISEGLVGDSENNIMRSRGFFKIYDAGNEVWEKIYR